MRTAAVLLAYAVVLGFGLHQTFGPVLKSGFTRVQSERGDGMLNHYILEHTWQSISNPYYQGSLFSPPCFYPTRSTLWYSEHLLGVAPLYWALRVVMPYDFAYQWWQIILEALNFVAFAVVIRWLRGPHILAILGGYLWAFSLINIDQIKHQQMIPRFGMVLAAYHSWQFVMAIGSTPAQPTRHLNRMMAAVFLQAITCVNTGWFLVTGLATFVPLALTLRPRGWASVLRFMWEHHWRVALIFVGWGMALIAAYVPYLVVNWGLGRGYDECLELMPTPASWFAPLPGTMWDHVVGANRNNILDENWLFCGFGIDVLMFAAVVSLVVSKAVVSRGEGQRAEYGVMLAAMLTSALWIIFTLKLGADESLWRYVRHIPGGGAVRCVSRVYVTVYLFGVLASLVWLARVTVSLRPPIRSAVLGLIAAVCIIEQYGYEPPSFDKQDFYPIVDRVAEELKKGDIGYMIQPYTDTNGERPGQNKLGNPYDEVLGMWAGLRANVPVVNGYSGRVPNEAFLEVIMVPDIYRVPHLRIWLHGRFRGKVALVDPDHPEATQIIVIE